VEEIARGGQGALLRAQHHELGTEAALKLSLDADEDSWQRFQQEAKALARLSHPNLLAVHDYGRAPGGLYMAMPFVSGQDLSSRVREQGVPPVAWTVEVLEAVADTLHYCHQSGIVHRDLKPQNVLIEAESGRPYVVDFGLIKRDRSRLAWSQDQAPETAEGTLLGTPAYMAPEQAAARGEVDARADVYGLGALLFFLLTGEAPFRAAGLYPLLAEVAERPPPDPRELRPEVPAALAELCRVSLAKDPAARPPTARAFAERVRATRPRARWPYGVGAGLLVAAAALLIWSQGPDARARATPAPASAPASTTPLPSPTPSEAVSEAAIQANNRGVALFDAGRIEEAIRAFAEATRLAPAYADAHLNRGLARAKLRDVAGAIEDFDRAMRLRPDWDLPYANRGATLGVLGDHLSASADFERATQLAPDVPRHWLRLGGAKGNLGDHAGAMACFERALELEPDAPWAERYRRKVARIRQLQQR